jgi:hypothetical protein
MTMRLGDSYELELTLADTSAPFDGVGDRFAEQALAKRAFGANAAIAWIGFDAVYDGVDDLAAVFVDELDD